jgi:hypothetical protein
MKAKDLIRVLQALDPESGVSMSLGNNNEYREKCAKAELVSGGCLEYLSVDTVKFYNEYDELWCDIILRQNNICELDETAKRFDEKFQRIKKS